MTALEIRSITKRFGDLTAVDNVSFTMDPGQIWGFIGPNGAGKTTAMRICSTLSLPDEGDVRVDGYSILEEPREVRARIGFMPDQYGAYTSTTIFEYLDFFARAYGLRGKARHRTLSDVMDFTALDGISKKLTSSLSKGMKQRLCLAKTLLHDPVTLILDEPAAGLDPRARVELRELVKAMAEMGKAILISSHILSELSEICDSVAVIEKGQLQAMGSVEDIVRGITPHREIYMRTLSGADLAQRTLAEMPRIQSLRLDRNGVAFDFEGSQEELADLLATLIAKNLQVVEFAARETDLEDVFLKLTEGKVQ
jgi:ABC-2 type transport system ATP-binding protein